MNKWQRFYVGVGALSSKVTMRKLWFFESLHAWRTPKNVCVGGYLRAMGNIKKVRFSCGFFVQMGLFFKKIPHITVCEFLGCLSTTLQKLASCVHSFIFYSTYTFCILLRSALSVYMYLKVIGEIRLCVFVYSHIQAPTKNTILTNF